MKNQYLLCLLVLWFMRGHVTLGQCPTGNVMLTTQAQVNAFPAGCSALPGSLRISGDDITNLSGLESLTSIGGQLNILANRSLTSVSSLSALQQVGGIFQIAVNADLPTLSGLESLTSVGENLTIANNLSLTSVSGLSALRQVGGSLQIGNNALPTLSGLESLTSIGSSLSIADSPSLTSVSGLSALRQVGVGFIIENNAALPTLSGLQSLTSIGWFLRIQNNTQLSTCATKSICQLLPTLPGNITISGNAPGCATLAEVEANCPGPGITGFVASFNPVCTGSPVSFTATVSNVTGTYNYTLTNGSTSINGPANTTAFSQTLTVGGSGSQSFTLIVSSGGTPATAITSLTVLAPNVTRLYVKANATGANTGLSWQDAFTDLQSALKYPCVGNLREIWIARGVYKPRSNDDIHDAFSMLPDVAIYGGFEGTESELSQRPTITLSNPSSTTLSADIDNDGTVANNAGFLVYNTRRLTSTAILDGVVMTQTGYIEGVVVGAISNVSSGDPSYQDLYYDQPVGNESSAQFRNILFTGFVGTGRVSFFFIANNALKGGVTKPSFINCVVRDNQIGLVSNRGDDLSSGISSVVAPQFVNCVIANTNNSINGQNLPFLYTSQTNSIDQSAFINCSFLNIPAGVVGSTSSGENGSSPNDIQLANCVLWNTGGVNTFAKLGANSLLNVTVQYSLLDGAITGYTSGPGNLTATSLPFVSTTDLNLPGTSTAVNAGNPASVTVANGPYSATNLPQTDAAANLRIRGGQVDMEALEVQNPTGPCGTVVYVTQNGAGSQNGSSWANAFAGTALKTAINIAATCGAQVWVAQGLYKPTTGTDRTISYSMKESVAIYGGFRGTEAQLGDRPGVNPVTGQPSSSTLSGDIGTPGDSGENSDNSFHIISNGSGLSERAVLDGFVLTQANAQYEGDKLGDGGAISNTGPLCNPTIRNCLFVNNYADNTGGAIYNKNSSPVIETCVFDNNMGFQMGGGIFSEGTASLAVRNSSFKKNQSHVGGAVYTNGQAVLTLTDCSFDGNTADESGAINGGNYTDLSLTRCQFLNNTATDGSGGVMYLAQGSLIATDCLFRNNSSTKEGGVLSSQVNATLVNCLFQDNSGNSNGGAISASTSMTLINCGFQGNKADQGGAIYTGGNMTMANCSFLANQANSGGAVVSEGSTIQLLNSVLWNNGGANSITYSYNGDQISASYSLFEPNVTGYTDGGNNLTTTLSPFVSTTSTQLRDCSLAINTGSTTAYNTANGPATDLAGNARQYNGGVIDRGSYEYQGTPTILTISNPAISTATVGQAFSQSFTASGGSGSYSFSVVSANLPASLSLSASGVLSGTPTAAGSYSVLVQVSDANGCVGVANAAYSLVVNNIMLTITGFAVTPNPVCVGSPITFTATIGNIAGNYGWALSSGGPPIGSPSPTTVTAFSVVQTALVSGVQTFTLTINSGGQMVTATTSLTVNSLPTASLTNNGPLTCAQTSVTLTASGGTSYSFTNSSGQTVPGSGNTRTVSSPGTYSVTVRDGNSCVSATTTTVGSNTVLSLSAGASLPQANVGVVVGLTASAETSVGVTSYQWSSPPTAPLTTPSTGSAVSASLTASGVQTFTVVGTSGVCSQSALVSVTALAGPDLSAIINLPDANFSTGAKKGLVVGIQEVNGATSSGSIVITITVPVGYSVSFDNTLTSIQVSGGSSNPVAVQNTQWHQSNEVAGQQISIAINTGQSVGANSMMDLGFSISRTTANAGSVSNITVNIADDSGGSYDVNRFNNVYARIISGL